MHKCCARLAQVLCTLGPARAPLHERFARGFRLAVQPPTHPCTHLHRGPAFCTTAFARLARGLCTLCTTKRGGRGGGAALCTNPSHTLHEGARHAWHERPRLARRLARRPRLCTRLLCALHVGFAHFAPRFSSTTALPRVRLHSALFGSTRLRSGCGPNPMASPGFGSTRLFSAQFGPARAVAPTPKQRSVFGSTRLNTAALGSTRLSSAPFGLCTQPYGIAGIRLHSTLFGSVRPRSRSSCHACAHLHHAPS